MADSDNTRDAPAPANNPQDPRAVLADGQLTEFRVITLEEAEAQAKADAKGLQRKRQRLPLFKRRAKTTPPPKPRDIKPERLLTVTDYGDPCPNTPWIRLRGRWLTEAGFPVRCRIRVQVEKGRLIITPEGASG